MSCTFLDASARDKSGITRRRCDEQTSCVCEIPALGHRLQSLLCADNVRRIAALAGAEDPVACLELPR